MVFSFTPYELDFFVLNTIFNFMIKIRPIRLNELAIIQHIAQNTWPTAFGDVLPMEQIKYMLELMYSKESLTKQIKEKHHQFLLAFNEENPIGFTSYELNYDSKPETMIHKLYILPHCQGLGAGSLLINHVSRIAKTGKNNQIRLKVYFDNPKAIGFYKKIGFQINGIATTDIGNDYIIVDYVMIKNI